MYTQCPHCDLAFRVTAPDLKRASGSVLCAGCSREFNALEKLTEDPPAVAGVADDPGSLLDTLNDFSGGHEIRIEDTGVEWRVIDEDEADEELIDDSVMPSDGITVEGDAPDPDEEAERLHAPEDDGLTSSVRWYLDEPVDDAAAAGAPEAPVSETGPGRTEEPANGSSEQPTGDAEATTHFELDVQRYDDNTPLPEDFVEDEEPQAFARRAEDRLEPRTPEADEAQVDLALGEADEWMDLLDEVAQRNEAAASRDDSEAGAVVREALQEVAATGGEAEATAPSTPPPAAAGEDALAETDIGPFAEDDEQPIEEPAADDFPSDIDTQFDLQALEMGIDLTGSRNLALEEEPGELELVKEEPPGNEQQREEERAEEEIPATGPPLAPPLVAAALEEELAHESDEQAQATDYRAEDEDSDEAEARRREEAFEQELAAAWATSADEVNLEGASPGDARALEDEQATLKSEPSQEEDDDGETAHYVPPQTEEEMTINMLIDQDLIRLAEQQDVFTRAHSRLEEAPHVETIIMEGDFVRHALEAELGSGSDTNGEHGRSAAGERRSGTPKSGTPGSHDDDDILDTYVKSTDSMRGGRRRTDPSSYRVIAGVAALALVLAAQVVHAYRDALATYPAFDRTIGSVYRLLGEPLNPDWNIKEWHFEATSGRMDETEDLLTISSRLANGSQAPLPYPLLHVSLTDRREEIIGSKVVEPGDYLDAGADPAARVPPGERFTATVRVQAPSPEATGFKLNVCYREPPDRVRCATEDFKN